eukprot:scaffold235043_cov18-Tisochrysis_lutea.AAC.1
MGTRWCKAVLTSFLSLGGCMTLVCESNVATLWLQAWPVHALIAQQLIFVTLVCEANLATPWLQAWAVR